MAQTYDGTTVRIAEDDPIQRSRIIFERADLMRLRLTLAAAGISFEVTTHTGASQILAVIDDLVAKVKKTDKKKEE